MLSQFIILYYTINDGAKMIALFVMFMVNYNVCCHLRLDTMHVLCECLGVFSG